jgi:adenylate kinase family enzyme
VKRVVVLGRGAAGKSTLARRLAASTRLPVVELDERFWGRGLVPRSKDEWAQMQRELVAPDTWILDGDLGPYDVLDVRLGAADTVIVLDFSFFRCAARAVLRSRERRDFWSWLWRYRRRELPSLLEKIRQLGDGARVHVLRTPRETSTFLRSLAD